MAARKRVPEPANLQERSRSGGGRGNHKNNHRNANTDQSKKARSEGNGDVRARMLWWMAVIFLAVVATVIHRDHIFKLFENDKHFSHLSNLEREMAFRTEMGLYYSYFKIIAEAPSFLDGLYMVTHDNLTEYPHTINTLKRFNLYPEVVLGMLYRAHEQFAKANNMHTRLCWTVNRGEGKTKVQSCEGLGEPTYFVVHAVMLLNGLMMGIYFLFGVFLSNSIMGGVVTVATYFFNHGEATRVMWTPPLRESYAFPFLVVEMFWLAYILRLRKPNLKHSLVLAALVTSFMLPWQFAQFALMTQLVAVLGCYVLRYINKEKMRIIVLGHTGGLLVSFILLFGNEMLLTSFYASCILSVHAILFFDDYLRLLKFQPVIIVVQGVMLLIGMVGLKFLVSQLLQVEDDAHISDILRSKFGDFKSFDTLLYTCAQEFDFLGYEYYQKLTLSLLIPTALFIIIGVAIKLLLREYKNWKYNLVEGILFNDNHDAECSEKEHAEVLYSILQAIAFMFMAVIIMRLKLFATPQLCLISSLVCSRELFGFLCDIKWHRAAVVGLLGLMAVKGIASLQQQWSIQGEYSNYPLEELITWINDELPRDAVFGGPMPLMANLKLSTGHPIVNHPHYEDAGLRARTKQIYALTSRKDIAEVHSIVKAMKVDYVFFEGGWCHNAGAKPGCLMPEIWDVEDTENHGKPPLCETIMQQSEPYFKKVYDKTKFTVFKVM